MTAAQIEAARIERVENNIAAADAPKRRFSLEDLQAMPDDDRLALLPGALIVIGAFLGELMIRQAEAKGTAIEKTA